MKANQFSVDVKYHHKIACTNTKHEKNITEMPAFL